MRDKINLTKLGDGVFYKYIYPVYPKEFLFGIDYETYATIVSEEFILNERQWDNILIEWEIKEAILRA